MTQWMAVALIVLWAVWRIVGRRLLRTPAAAPKPAGGCGGCGGCGTSASACAGGRSWKPWEREPGSASRPADL